MRLRKAVPSIRRQTQILFGATLDDMLDEIKRALKLKFKIGEKSTRKDRDVAAVKANELVPNKTAPSK